MNGSSSTATTTTTTTSSSSSSNANDAAGVIPVRKVAVIGGGVSGLSAAWHLSSSSSSSSSSAAAAASHTTNQHHNKTKTHDVDVTLFESEPRLGGHAYTVPVPIPVASTSRNPNPNENKTATILDVDVDIGFMVFNESNYPNMCAWFQAMNNEKQQEEDDEDEKSEENKNNNSNSKSNSNSHSTNRIVLEDTDMSLSVSLDQGQTVEWNSSNGLNGVFAKRSQLYDRKFYTMLKDLLKFHREGPNLLVLDETDPRKHVTTHQYLQQHGYSSEFQQYYLFPMMAALWSASMEDVLQFPAQQLLSFLCNHQMLQLFHRPQVRIQ